MGRAHPHDVAAPPVDNHTHVPANIEQYCLTDAVHATQSVSLCHFRFALALFRDRRRSAAGAMAWNLQLFLPRRENVNIRPTVVDRTSGGDLVIPIRPDMKSATRYRTAKHHREYLIHSCEAWRCESHYTSPPVRFKPVWGSGGQSPTGHRHTPRQACSSCSTVEHLARVLRTRDSSGPVGSGGPPDISVGTRYLMWWSDCV